MYPQMTSDDVAEGMRVTIQVAHRLKVELGRLPSLIEIQWRTATQFQYRDPQSGLPMSRHNAMVLARQMMDVVSATIEYTTPN